MGALFGCRTDETVVTHSGSSPRGARDSPDNRGFNRASSSRPHGAPSSSAHVSLQDEDAEDEEEEREEVNNSQFVDAPPSSQPSPRSFGLKNRGMLRREPVFSPTLYEDQGKRKPTKKLAIRKRKKNN